LYARTWIPWYFFSGVVTFGSIGRQLAMVSKDLPAAYHSPSPLLYTWPAVHGPDVLWIFPVPQSSSTGLI